MMNHAPVLRDLIINNNCKVVAEIGVHRGRLSRWILRSPAFNVIEEYWGVDPYRVYHSGEEQWDNFTQEQWEELYLGVIKYFTFPQFKLVRAESVRTAKYFPKKYFDLIFIDAQHTYNAVKEDIEAWLPRIKNNGLFTGHDYDHPLFPGVKKAVDEMLRETNIRSFGRAGGRVWVYGTSS